MNPPTSCRFQRFEADEKKITEDYRATCFSKLYWMKKDSLKTGYSFFQFNSSDNSINSNPGSKFQDNLFIEKHDSKFMDEINPSYAFPQMQPNIPRTHSEMVLFCLESIQKS